MKNEKLLVREFVAVTLFISLILGIAALSYLNQYPSQKSSIPPSEEVTVHVVGAVHRPGKYTVPKQAMMASLLKHAEPQKDACVLSSIKIHKNPIGESFLAIPHQGAILVHLSGQVHTPGWIELPLKTRICDLPQHVSLKAADKKFLKRKKLLQNGAFVVVP